MTTEQKLEAFEVYLKSLDNIYPKGRMDKDQIIDCIIVGVINKGLTLIFDKGFDETIKQEIEAHAIQLFYPD